jgi:hypothetical protein
MNMGPRTRSTKAVFPRFGKPQAQHAFVGRWRMAHWDGGRNRSDAAHNSSKNFIAIRRCRRRQAFSIAVMIAT